MASLPNSIKSAAGLPLSPRRRANDQRIARGGAHDLPAITEHSPVGTGCGTCRRDVERIIRETLDAPDPEANAAGSAISNGAKGRIALMHNIVGKLQPLLAEVDGQSPEIWDLNKNVVIIRAGPGDWDVLQDRCERLLKDEVDPLLKVEVRSRPSLISGIADLIPRRARRNTKGF